MDSETFDELRDELAFQCDAAGVIRWQDGCARRVLGDRVGAPLNSLAVPGTGSKLDELLVGLGQFLSLRQPVAGGLAATGLHLHEAELAMSQHRRTPVTRLLGDAVRRRHARLARGIRRRWRGRLDRFALRWTRGRTSRLERIVALPAEGVVLGIRTHPSSVPTRELLSH